MRKQLQAPYGRISMQVLKRKDLTTRQKLVYAIIAAKQGGSDYAKLNYQMIADALEITGRYVTETTSKLIELGIIQKVKRGQLAIKLKSRQWGLVELDMLITENLSIHAKFLYLIYCTTANDHDANIWSKEKICKKFHMGGGTYCDAHQELVANEILKVFKRAKGDGLQTSNINHIVRSQDFQTVIPESWLPEPVFNLDDWCEQELPVRLNRNRESNPKGTGSPTEQEPTVQRTITINNNLNSEKTLNRTNTNEAFSPKNSDRKSDAVFLQQLKEVGELTEKPCYSINEVNETIASIRKYGIKASFIHIDMNQEVIEMAFVAFEAFRKELLKYDVDTSGYALNLRDIDKFDKWFNCLGPCEDDIDYHIARVIELGFNKVKKSYIGFGYVFSSRHPDLKQPAIS